MTMPRVQFMFDFGSPNAYLFHKVIPGIKHRAGLKFEYLPVLLGGLFKLANNRSPAESLADIPKKRAYEMLEMKRFVARHELSQFRFNPFFPVNTLKIMRGAVAAQQMECFEAYVDAVYAAMWEQGRNMDDVSEVIDVLGVAGIDSNRLIEMSQQPDVKNELLANTQSAFERGAFGSPTFFVGNEMFFGKDRLEQVELEIGELAAR
ncbi:MAG: 2-hydroxychromene-2-carboxylate isomerase [Polaromonas sp.]|nr:2-hydroxychromene-2-carboxylate isomerase [Polaromonas sp.]